MNPKVILTWGLLLALSSFVAANQVYKWKTIQFKDLPRDVDTIVDGENVYYNEENVLMSSVHYDLETGFICAAFPRIKPSVPVTVGCFSADEYDQQNTPKFTAFPTVADNDLPDWPEAKLPLGESRRRVFNYRQSRGRKNFTQYYYRDVNDSEDEEWVRGGVYQLEAISNNEDTARGFTGFNSLGNIFLKKDKKDVVVAVVDDRDKNSHTPYEWSSAENNWKPHKKVVAMKPKNKPKPQIAYIVVPNEEEEEEKETKKQQLFRFFGSKLAQKLNFFKKPSTERPVYQVNVNNFYDSEEEDHHHKPKPKPRPQPPKLTPWDVHQEGHASWYSDEQSDERWSPIPKPSKNKKKTTYKYPSHAAEVPLYYPSAEEHYSPYPQKHKKTKRPDPEEIPLYFDQERNLDTSKPANKPLIQLVDGSGESEDEEQQQQKPSPSVQENPIQIPRPFNFINVHKVLFDKCGRLWFIDIGTMEYKTNPIFYRNPILWSFEVKVSAKGKLISRPYLRYELDDSTPTGLRGLAVDIHENCDDYHVYIPNSKDNRMIVFSSEKQEHWQFEHPSMAPVLKEMPFTVQDETYQVAAGIYSLTLGPRDAEGFRDVFFTPVTGTGQYKVSTQLLREKGAAPNFFNPKAIKFVGYRGEGEGLTRAQVYDPRTDVIFSSSVEETSIKCWNTKKLLTPDNYGTVYSHMDMVFGSDIQLDRKGNLWALSNKYPIYFEKGLNPSEVNFSLFRVKPRDVIKGTVCAGGRRDRALGAASDPSTTDKRFDGEVEEEEKKAEESVTPKEETVATEPVTESVVQDVVVEEKKMENVVA